MAEVGVPVEDSEFIPLLPEGARWGDIKDIDSDVEEQEPAAAADGEDEFETDPKRLIARQQQIDFGKNTLGYERYLQAVPKPKRKLRGKEHDPPTPDITQKMSKRSWDGIVKAWRRHLHKFDTVDTANPAAAAAAAGAGEGAAGAADMQVDAPAAVPDARRAGPNGKQWRASGIKRRGSKQQSSSSNQRVRQDDTAGQQQQEQQRMRAPEKNSPPQLQTTTAQRQQQNDKRSRDHTTDGSRPGSRREESSSRRHGSSSGGTEFRRYYDSNMSRRGNPSSRHSYQRAAAAAEHNGVDGEHERDYGQPPRYSSSTTLNSRERGHGSGSGSRDHRGGSRSHQQPRDASGVAAAAAAAETGRKTPDTTAAGSGSRQLTPAKRGSSSQGDVDKRPPKHG